MFEFPVWFTGYQGSQNPKAQADSGKQVGQKKQKTKKNRLENFDERARNPFANFSENIEKPDPEYSLSVESNPMVKTYI